MGRRVRQVHFTRPVRRICTRELVSGLVSTCFRNRRPGAPPNSVWPVQGIYARGPCFQLVPICFRHVCQAQGPMFPDVSVAGGRALRVASTTNLRQYRSVSDLFPYVPGTRATPTRIPSLFFIPSTCISFAPNATLRLQQRRGDR